MTQLIPKKPPRPTSTEGRRAVVLLGIEEIRPNLEQPRKTFDEASLDELAASVKAHGLMQPILVRDAKKGGYEIVAGERRWRACQRAGLKQVEVIVQSLADEQLLEWALVENIQREDLNPIEEASAYRKLLDRSGESQEQLGVRIGKDRSTISNALRLLKLPEEVRRQVIASVITMGHARALLGMDSPEGMVRLARDIVKRGLSVREVERIVKKARESKNGAAGGADPYHQLPGGETAVRRASEQLQRSLGTKVRIVPKGRRGRIEIDFSSPDELNRLLDCISD